MKNALLAAAIVILSFVSLATAQSTQPAAPVAPTQMPADWWPTSGQQGTGRVQDGYLIWNGKPFFRNFHHGWCSWSHKRQDIFKVYRYYLLCNTANVGEEAWVAAKEIFKKGYDEGIKSDVVTHRFQDATRMYDNKVLASLYLPGMQYSLPESLRSKREEDIFDAFNASIVKTATDFARAWSTHPGLGAYEISEEYWLPGTYKDGFIPSKARYAGWLSQKYGTIEKMNSVRGESYKSFDEVPIPQGKFVDEAGVNNLDYADFLTSDNARRLQLVYDSLKKAAPNIPLSAAKGEWGRAEWFYCPPSDLFGWYCSVPGGYGVSNSVPRTAVENFGKVFECIHVNYCRYGRRDSKWPEGEPFKLDLRGIGYPHTITEIFEGMKDHWLEDYNDGSFHYFHPTKMIREVGEIKTWSGAVLNFHKDGLEGPDVIAEPSTLGMSRAFAWAQRTAPLFLPTRVEKGNLGVLMTGRSMAVGGSMYIAGKLWRETPEALRRMQVPYGIVREENVKDLSKYKVLLAGPAASATSSQYVDAVKAFVKAGGKLIIMPGAFSKDEFHRPTPKAREEIEAIAAVRLEEPAKLDLQANDFWPQALAAYRQAFEKAGVVAPASLSGGTDPLACSDLTMGVLKGDGYYLAGIASFSEKDQRVTLKVNCLPAGNYEVIDVTGERPLLQKDDLAGWALKTDEEYRATKVLATASAADLAAKGMANIDVISGAGRILLIRQMAKVVVSCPAYEVATIALSKVGTDIVLPAEASDKMKAAAKTLADAIKAKGGSAAVIAPADVKIAKTTFDAYIHPQVAKYESKIAVFQNQPLDTQRNLLVIGSQETNPLVKHLAAVGTFTYDKVLEKVTAGYPGKGRGLIGVVESVNDPSFDATDKTRDALIIGGSDEEGTLAAMAKVAEILTGAK